MQQQSQPKMGTRIWTQQAYNTLSLTSAHRQLSSHFQERTTLLAKFSMLSVVIILPIQQKACLGYDLPRRDFSSLTFLVAGHKWLKGVLILTGDTQTPLRYDTVQSALEMPRQMLGTCFSYSSAIRTTILIYLNIFWTLVAFASTHPELQHSSVSTRKHHKL